MNPGKRRSTDQSGQNDDVVSDVQYILQTLTGMEDRLTKLENSISRLGNDIYLYNIIPCVIQSLIEINPN